MKQDAHLYLSVAADFVVFVVAAEIVAGQRIAVSPGVAVNAVQQRCKHLRALSRLVTVAVGGCSCFAGEQKNHSTTPRWRKSLQHLVLKLTTTALGVLMMETLDSG